MKYNDNIGGVHHLLQQEDVTRISWRSDRIDLPYRAPPRDGANAEESGADDRHVRDEEFASLQCHKNNQDGNGKRTPEVFATMPAREV